MGALLALASAVGFGSSDVAGAVAVATRRSAAPSVAIGIVLSGALVLVPLLALMPGTPSIRALAFGAAAGLVGNLGLVLYLRCMALEPIGVISPIAGLVGAGIPIGWGAAILGDELAAGQLGGILLGLVSVVSAKAKPPPARTNLRGVPCGAVLDRDLNAAINLARYRVPPPGSGPEGANNGRGAEHEPDPAYAGDVAGREASTPHQRPLRQTGTAARQRAAA